MADKPFIEVQTENAPADLQGSSWLSYNGLLLTDVLTESYEMQEERTPDLAQVLCKKHVIKVTAIINPAVNSYFRSGNPNAYPVRQPVAAAAIAGNITLIRDQLLQDSKVLIWAVGGTVVLNVPRFNPNNLNIRMACDAMQGPRPLYCQVTQIAGTSSYYVRFGIETWVDDCVDGKKFIKSHRYSMSHDVDGDTWLTSRMVQGQITFHPEWLQASDKKPDFVEHQWAHPVPPGFKRHNVKVQAHPNGYELAYSFVDTEQTLPLGSKSPATKLSAEFSVSSSLGSEKAALTQAAVHISAVGPKNQFRFNLLHMAIKLANRKIQKAGHVMTTDIVITYSLDNTMVDLTLKALWKPVGVGADGLQVNMAGLDAVADLTDIDAAFQAFRIAGEGNQGTQSDIAVSPKLRNNDTMGTWAGFVVGSSLVNGCFTLQRPTNFAWAGENNGKSEEDLETSGSDFELGMSENNGTPIPFTLTVTPILTLTPLSTGISAASANGTGLYEQWEMDTSYRTSHQKAVMPVGAKQNTSPGDAVTYLPPQVGTLGLPYTLKVVSWTVAWIGNSPSNMLLPSPETGDSNDVLLAEDISPAVPSIANSTNKCWRVSGTYWYLTKLLRTASVTIKGQYTYVDQGFAMGKSITDPNVQASNTVGLVRFVAGYSPSFV